VSAKVHFRGPGGAAACRQMPRRLWTRKKTGGLVQRQVRKTDNPAEVTCLLCRAFALARSSEPTPSGGGAKP
jgi:hypothetical protein